MVENRAMLGMENTGWKTHIYPIGKDLFFQNKLNFKVPRKHYDNAYNMRGTKVAKVPKSIHPP